MAKALLGYLSTPDTRSLVRLTADNRRLHQRVADLEAYVARLESQNEALTAMREAALLLDEQMQPSDLRVDGGRQSLAGCLNRSTSPTAGYAPLVHLKSLTLRGFKSFASTTTLEFEPGITCIVGPNGSGKSNVVDALAWVMGEQGAKSLRGGKMEDVIFAGTSGRPPLGRAEVLLTIDNTDGALPIEYAEVTISRTLFRNGGSEYAVNGTSCRLLDVQDCCRTPASVARCMSSWVRGSSTPSCARHPRSAGVHRGGGRRPQAPQAQGEGAAQARLHRHQPDSAERPARRDPSPAETAGQAGGGGTARCLRPGGRP
jgi:energy-coupling factor transporter ATP-binding protein EcfA2